MQSSECFASRSCSSNLPAPLRTYSLSQVQYKKDCPPDCILIPSLGLYQPQNPLGLAYNWVIAFLHALSESPQYIVEIVYWIYSFEY